MVHYSLIFVLCGLLAASGSNVRNKRQSTARSFPADFGFGAATASYQIEGAWDEDGKGWSMWDYLVRTDPTHIADNSTGDIAANSYHLYKKDIELLKFLGATQYRFSISWPRILPYGRDNYINQRGIDHYNRFIDELIANGITPFVTMYHWDLPQNLSEQGGWTNEEIVEWFGNYARVLYRNFGDRVKHWMTINEPFIHCNFGYGYGQHAPRMRSPGVGFYECGRNILLANARAYHIYNEEFRSTQNGEVGIVLSSDWVYPASESQNDIDAAHDYLVFHLRFFMDPIFSTQGNYPQVLIDRVQAASTAQGLTTSRLRPLTQEQIDYIRGSSDFLALNSYTSRIAYRNNSLIGTFEVPSHDDDAFLAIFQDDAWPASQSPWLREHAPGFYNLLVYLKDNYNNPTIYITENGFASTVGLLDDPRTNYYRNYLSALLDALAAGVNVKGYFAWSLLDNFEWAFGYTARFGLFQVDMESPERTRTPRKSALVYKEIIRSRSIDYDYNPDPYAYDTDGAFAFSASIILTIGVAVLNIAFALLTIKAECNADRRFPEEFLFGASTAAYQIEGGWDADCKGVSMWDYYLHKQPSLVEDLSNGDVAADSYHLYKRDVELLKELGVKSYRFSISWTRILPNGTADYINPYGIIYYNNLIDELTDLDLYLIVNIHDIYHWDLPIDFSDKGGWLTEDIVGWYSDYARVVFTAFGDRVKHWITVNEPHIHCTFSYGAGLHPPLIKSPGKGFYECGRNLLLAHAAAFHLYDEEFRLLQGGKVGVTVDHAWPLAATDSEDDAEAVKDYNAFYLGQYLDPILKGDYPQRLIKRVDEQSAIQGYTNSRLRPFTQKQKEYIKGTADFIGLNHYSSTYVYRNASVEGTYEIPSFDDDTGLGLFQDPSWPQSAFPTMAEYAPGFFDLLLYIKDTYDNPVLYVTENGFPLTIDNGLNDDMKVHYLRNYLNALLEAKAAGSNVQGYFFWSLLDTLEWTSGYGPRFALHQVDMNDPARPRTARKSALIYKEIIRSGVIDYDYNSNPYDQ